MPYSSMKKKLDYRFQSRIDNIYPAEREILAQAKNLGYDEDALFSLRLAMDEALINAIIHGNKNSAQKYIDVTAHCCAEKITVTVRDEGKGFDRSQLVDPRQKPFVQKSNGRGVFLIHQFTHEVQYNDTGNEVSFTIQRGQPISILQAS